MAQFSSPWTAALVQNATSALDTKRNHVVVAVVGGNGKVKIADDEVCVVDHVVEGGLTVLEAAVGHVFRWIKVADAGNAGAAHVLARWLNPACVEEDFNCDGQIELARKGLEHFFPNDVATVNKIWTQHKLHVALDANGPLLCDLDGTKKRT